MENGTMILVDTSVLIDYFRKSKKDTTFFVSLSERYDFFAISVVTKFEIYIGSNDLQKVFWDNVFENFTILPLTEECTDKAVEIQQELRRTGNPIDFADLLIGATAKFNDLPIATLNAKHFNRIIDVKVITK